jgi:ribosome-associated heat shock protein Hsp15
MNCSRVENAQWVEWAAEVSDMVDEAEKSQVRLDVWLDVACLFRTRSEAQKACKGGKVDVNGQRAKSNRLMRVGDKLEISRPYGRKQRLAVRALANRHVARTEARLLYEDLTPPATPEEIEIRRMERVFRALMTTPRAPDKRQRRALRRIKGRDD